MMWSLPASSSRYSGREIPRSHAMWPSLTPSRSRSRGRCWTRIGSMVEPSRIQPTARGNRVAR